MKQLQLLAFTFLFLFLGCSEENSPITMISLYQITPIQSPKTVETHGRASDVKIIDIVKTEMQGIDP